MSSEATTQGPAGFPANPVPKKRGGGKKSVKKAARRKPWYVALEPAILNTVLGKAIGLILARGVSSRSDLLKKLEEAVGGAVGQPTLNRWLETLGYDKIFTEKKVYTLPSQQVPGPAPVRDVPGQMELGFMGGGQPAPVPEPEDDGSDLNTQLPIAMRAAQEAAAAAMNLSSPGSAPPPPQGAGGGFAGPLNTAIPTFR